MPLAPLALLLRFMPDTEALGAKPPLPALASPVPLTGLLEAPVEFGPTDVPDVPAGAVRLAMTALTALSHLISSSSLGAQSNKERFVVTTLKVCCPPC